MKTYLLDTSVLITLFSRHTADSTRRVLRKRLKKNSILYLCGLVLAEFYQGIERKEAEYYSALLEEFPYLSSARAIYENAGLIGHRLKKAGNNVPLGDRIIAETAKMYKVEVVTYDKHFQKYPGLKVLFLKSSL